LHIGTLIVCASFVTEKTVGVAIWKKVDNTQTSIQTSVTYIISSAGCKQQWSKKRQQPKFLSVMNSYRTAVTALQYYAISNH